METRKIKKALFMMFGILMFSAMMMSTEIFATVSQMPSAENGVITLTDDVELTSGYVVNSGETVTIDLNGYTIKTVSGLKADAITVSLGGTLTIKGDGKVTNSYSADNYAALFNNGTTTIEGGTFELDEATNSNTYYVIVNHGTMTIENATVTSTDTSSSLIENGYSNYTSGKARNGYVEGTNQAAPTLTINDGTYDGGLNTIKNDDNAEVVINGGTFKNTTQVSLMNWNIATINGGTFNTPAGEDKTNIFVGNYGADSVDKGILVINDGTFNADYLLESSTGVVTTVEVKGGTLNCTVADTSSEYLNTSSINITGEVTSPSSALAYAKSGATITVTDTDVDAGDEYTVADGVTVVFQNIDDTLEAVTQDDGTVVIQEKVADYTEVEEAVTKARSIDTTLYTESSVEVLEDAIDAVVYDKKVSEQTTVDSYAEAINEALSELEEVQTEDDETSTTDEDTTTEVPDTGDEVMLYAVAFGVSLVSMIVVMNKRKAAKN